MSDEKCHNTGVPPHSGWEDDEITQILRRFEIFAKGAPNAMYREVKDDLGLYVRTLSLR